MSNNVTNLSDRRFTIPNKAYWIADLSFVADLAKWGQEVEEIYDSADGAIVKSGV